MKILLRSAALLLAGVAGLLHAKVEINPPDARAVASAGYGVTVDGQTAFTTKFRDISYASFAFDQTVAVVVRASAPITSYNVSPHAAGIVAEVDGSDLRFKVDQPRHLVVTVNGGEKLFLFAQALETDAPKPAMAGVTNILDCDVDPTGTRVETSRIQQAIDQVAANRSVLYFPPGVYLTGSISPREPACSARPIWRTTRPNRASMRRTSGMTRNCGCAWAGSTPHIAGSS